VLRTVRGSASIDEAQAEARTAQAAAAADRAAAPGTARHAVREQLATQVDRVLRDRPGRAGCLALAFDLLTLVGGFQARLAQFRADVVAAGRIVPPWLEEPTRARPIVLLDNVDQYDRSILEEILALAGQGGLGNAESPVPVVLSAALDGGPATTVLKPLVESRKPHLLARRLDPFPAADAMLVYQAVLLHPFNPALFEFGDVKSSIPFAPAAIVAADVARNVEDFFAVMLKGRPDRLAKEALYAAAREGVSKDYLIPADDTAIVKTLGIVR
jgi:hypothetical protein